MSGRGPDPTIDPSLGSWIPVPVNSDFPIQNLPYGVFRRPGEWPRVGVAIGNRILDLDAVAAAGLFEGHLELPPGVFTRASLNEFMSLGPYTWRGVRRRVSQLLNYENREIRDIWGLAEKALVPHPDVQLLLPFEVADYVDFYSSIEHATNLGKMFRPDQPPLLANWRHLPVGYHGRSSTVVVSGTEIQRPFGQLKLDDGPPVWGPTRALDFELEVGFVLGFGNELGRPIPVDRAEDHIFGMVLVNDWSARDVQRWEYVPLGPFLGKSFATSISPWVISLDTLGPYRIPAPEQDPPVLDYLQGAERLGLDLNLEVTLETEGMGAADLEPAVVSKTTFRHMYWTMAQQIAHASSNGTRLGTGDLYASGTVSGPDETTYGSMIELAWRGTRPIDLPDGSSRIYLEDGDTVVMRGHCGGAGMPRIGFGEVSGTVLPPGG